MERPQTVTLSDIARMAGVSRQVVSAICGISSAGSVRYGQATRERVERIVRQTRFRANRTAKNLVTKRHNALGVLLVEFGHMNDSVLRSMLREAHSRGQILILDTMLDEDTRLPVFLREHAVDGLVVFEDIEKRLDDEIERLSIPCVRVNTNLRTAPGCITFDETGAMRLAARHLAEMGRRRFAILASKTSHYSQKLRLQGLARAATEEGLSPPAVHTFERAHRGWSAGDGAVGQVVSFLRAHRGIDGVVLSVDTMAPVFYRAAAVLGKRIPDDIAVVGVNNSTTSWSVYPALTSLYVEPSDLGRTIVRTLSAAIDGTGSEVPPVHMTYRIEVRGSSATAGPARTPSPQTGDSR